MCQNGSVSATVEDCGKGHVEIVTLGSGQDQDDHKRRSSFDGYIQARQQGEQSVVKVEPCLPHPQYHQIQRHRDRKPSRERLPALHRSVMPIYASHLAVKLV